MATANLAPYTLVTVVEARGFDDDTRNASGAIVSVGMAETRQSSDPTWPVWNDKRVDGMLLDTSDGGAVQRVQGYLVDDKGERSLVGETDVDISTKSLTSFDDQWLDLSSRASVRIQYGRWDATTSLERSPSATVRQTWTHIIPFSVKNAKGGAIVSARVEDCDEGATAGKFKFPFATDEAKASQQGLAFFGEPDPYTPFVLSSSNNNKGDESHINLSVRQVEYDAHGAPDDPHATPTDGKRSDTGPRKVKIPSSKPNGTKLKEIEMGNGLKVTLKLRVDNHELPRVKDILGVTFPGAASDTISFVSKWTDRATTSIHPSTPPLHCVYRLFRSVTDVPVYNSNADGTVDGVTSTIRRDELQASYFPAEMAELMPQIAGARSVDGGSSAEPVERSDAARGGRVDARARRRAGSGRLSTSTTEQKSEDEEVETSTERLHYMLEHSVHLKKLLRDEFNRLPDGKKQQKRAQFKSLDLNCWQERPALYVTEDRNGQLPRIASLHVTDQEGYNLPRPFPLSSFLSRLPGAKSLVKLLKFSSSPFGLNFGGRNATLLLVSIADSAVGVLGVKRAVQKQKQATSLIPNACVCLVSVGNALSSFLNAIKGVALAPAFHLLQNFQLRQISNSISTALKPLLMIASTTDKERMTGSNNTPQLLRSSIALPLLALSAATSSSLPLPARHSHIKTDKRHADNAVVSEVNTGLQYYMPAAFAIVDGSAKGSMCLLAGGAFDGVVNPAKLSHDSRVRVALGNLGITLGAFLASS